MSKVKFIILSILIISSNLTRSAERELYFTDFEDAPVGDNELVGYDIGMGHQIIAALMESKELQ